MELNAFLFGVLNTGPSVKQLNVTCVKVKAHTTRQRCAGIGKVDIARSECSASVPMATTNFAFDKICLRALGIALVSVSITSSKQSDKFQVNKLKVN
jgi:hypothetical protein